MRVIQLLDALSVRQDVHPVDMSTLGSLESDLSLHEDTLAEAVTLCLIASYNKKDR